MRSLLLATTLAACAATAHAAPFTLFIYETAEDLALRSDTTEKGAAYWSAYAAIGKDMGAAGVLRGGSALVTTKVTTVSATGPAASAFAAAPLALGGYFQIDVADEAAAIEWAAKIPAAVTGAVEVRAGYAVPGM
jgi:hypothetical protein